MAGDSGNQEGAPISRKDIKKRPKLTREQLANQKRNQENRRNILKAGLGILGLTATGGLAKILTSQNSGERTPVTDEAAYYQDRLKTLNQELSKNPAVFKEIAPRIGDLAIQYFSKEMGYDQKRFLGKIYYERDNQFMQRLQTLSGCITTNMIDDDVAKQVTGTHEIIVNLDKIFNNSDQNGALNPSVALFGAVIHELLHAAPPILSIPGQESNRFRNHGFSLLRPDLSGSATPGYECTNSSRTQLEEAVVQEATARMTNKIGLPYPSDAEYDLWVNRYRDGILNKFFNGDNKPLLALHQQSQPDELFRTIGTKTGARPEEALQKGEQYLLSVLVTGKSP